MAVTPFQFVTDAVLGDVPNGFYPMKDSNRQVIMTRTPGKKKLCQLPNVTEVRALYDDPAETGDFFYAFGSQGSNTLIFRVDPVAGTYSQIGTITTSANGPMWIESNPTQIGICDGAYLWVYNFTTGILTNTGQAASALAYQDGHGLYLIPGTNTWGFTNVDDFTTIDPTNVYNTTAKPGNILGIMSYIREPYLMTGRVIEIWYDAGGDNTSPQTPTFALNTAGIIEIGLGAVGTPNTALGNMANWLSDTGEWQGAQGYSAQKVSTQMMDRAVQGYATFTDARCFTNRSGGHIFTQMNFPTGETSWVIDWTTQMVHKRSSYLTAGGFGRDRANCYCFCNDQHFVGDYKNGIVYQMSDDFYDDNGHPIPRTLYTVEKDGGLQRVYCSELQLLMDMGIGLQGGGNPQVGLEIYHDGGNTYSNIISVGAGP